MTVAESLGFLSGQAAVVRATGLEVHAISAPGPELRCFGEAEGVVVHAVPMTRRITPVQDLRSVWRTWRTLRAIRPQIVHAHTPKGGLVGMIAAALAGTPVRIYHIRGLPLVTATGLRRRLLWLAERLSCTLAHRVLAVSNSMRALAIAEGLCPPEKIAVLLSGSGNGVDARGRFRPVDVAARRAVRERHGIPADALVVGFLGRLVREKGIVELSNAWRVVREREPRVRLLLVGQEDATDPLPAGLEAALRSDPRVHVVGGVPFPEVPAVYGAVDVVALPTYREGFSNVALEAAAMGVPIVASRVPGCTDAVRDGETGTLVPPRDAAALAAALARYLADPELRARHGAAARRWVMAEFQPEPLRHALAAEYCQLLAAARAGGPAVPAAAPSRGVLDRT
ncbi:glycosyltransferase family 4 protein [Anaeromyxobacter oryzae]|uniref:Glycosyl transferase n=1 Tax=Anaeromyxobacter oryzae TaxID=2918170 RepID=A0ABN6MMV3_9BACT|nr:glycosyltransferase family 4 protein [Anaeromyxobacter oryzae]BDG02291.1 glycosyl transferase [Anaeromyxobacter oryzae]